MALAWWLIAIGFLLLVLLHSILTGTWGLFVVCVLIFGFVVRRTHERKVESSGS